MSRRKTYCEPPIKHVNHMIKTVFNKYLLASGKKIRYVKMLTPDEIFMFENPNKSIYIITLDAFNELFKGPMIHLTFTPDNLETDIIYNIKNSQVGSSLFIYKKKVVKKDCFIFEDNMGMRIIINVDDINTRIDKSTQDYYIIISGEYFDV